MLFAIISDSHDNLPNLEKFAAWAKKNKIERVIHCGDIASAEAMDVLTNGFGGPIDLVFGNMDEGRRDNLIALSANWPNAHFHGDTGELTIASHPLDRSAANPPRAGGDKIKIAFTHTPDLAKELGDSGKYQLVLCGHSHKPWLETTNNNCQLINPGTLGGVFNQATFAVFDTATKNLELKILELL